MKQLSLVLTPPAYFDWHKDVVNGKRDPCRTVLQSIEPRIKARFNEYATAIKNKNLETVVEDSVLQQSGNQLKSCYDGKTKKLAEMLRHVSGSQKKGVLKWCPYCGLTKPWSYDHYLPKELFPEFSVNPQNLVDCCTKCNSIKGARWKSGNVRLFIHFYSDQLPEEQFLFANVVHNDRALCASFRISQPAGVNDEVWAVIENHYRELGLLRSYSADANNEITSAVNWCIAHLQDGGTNPSSFLIRLAQGEERLFGRNHWRVVLWKSLAQHAEFDNIVIAEAGSRRGKVPVP